MNFSLDDRHRSLRRFLMNALGSPPWKVRTERQPVKDEERPVAVVEVVSAPATTRSRTSVPQGDVERVQTFSIALYPVLGATAAEARLAAAQVADLLDQAITVGLSTDAIAEIPAVEETEDTPAEEAVPGVPAMVLTAPQMFPVYDFDGVAVKGAERAGPSENYGWLRADDYGVRPIQDPEDPLRWTVVCDLRVSWEQAGRDRPEGQLAGSMPHTSHDWSAGGDAGAPLGGGAVE